MTPKFKTKRVIGFALALSMAASAMAVPMSASAAGTRTKAEAFGDATYTQKFLSLYDDVMTNGIENGYLSANNVASGGFGVPYHAVETMIVEAPDYGHETTSEAMSYLVWVAAMRDHLSKGTDYASSDLAKAWSTMEYMVPTVQTGMMEKSDPSATYSPELDDVALYPVDMVGGNTGNNPIHKYFTSAYSGDQGLYLMHWLADVDNWYGYGSGKTFTFINTFQRGAYESCWETVPHPSVEELKYGNERGIKGIFSTEGSIAKQWAYTNAPDAEDRAIQGVFAANRWGVGDANVTTLAGKMGDQLRNNFFDKYYKEISVNTTENSPSTGYDSAHFLRNWYTSWGGAMDGSWTWQIGCSHCHEFYQNPLAAYALLADSDLKSAMKGEKAVEDYETSLARQLEFYLWLQSAEGPIAGGATNSNRGRYAPYSDGILREDGTVQNVSSTFYDMLYVEHPVYLDPGSNHWIGNQVWAMQRIAELYKIVKQDGDKTGVKLSNGWTVEQACEKILDKWVAWAVDSIVLNDDGTYKIPASIDWTGEPDTWTGTPTDNSNLHATISAYGNADLGCVASFADIFIQYAAAKDVDGLAAVNGTDTSLAAKGLVVGKTLLDDMWNLYRDDIGLSAPDTNSNFVRLFEQEVVVPSAYGTGKMPNGDTIATGATFLSIRSMYKDDPMYATLLADYEDNGETDSTVFNYHRFWHAGDIMMALGYMATEFPELDTASDVSEDLTVDKSEVTVAVGETDKVTASTDVTWSSADSSIATVSPDGTITGVAAGETTITATDANGNTVDVKVTVTDEDVTTTTPSDSDILWGDVNVDGKVSAMDMVLLKKYVLEMPDAVISEQGLLNADVKHDGKVSTLDVVVLKQRLIDKVTQEELPL